MPPYVLAHQALVDILFFLGVFAVSVVAFSSMFYVQLGPLMRNYNDQVLCMRKCKYEYTCK